MGLWFKIRGQTQITEASPEWGTGEQVHYPDAGLYRVNMDIGAGKKISAKSHTDISPAGHIIVKWNHDGWHEWDPVMYRADATGGVKVPWKK